MNWIANRSASFKDTKSCTYTLLPDTWCVNTLDHSHRSHLWLMLLRMVHFSVNLCGLVPTIQLKARTSSFTLHTERNRFGCNFVRCVDSNNNNNYTLGVRITWIIFHKPGACYTTRMFARSISLRSNKYLSKRKRSSFDTIIVSLCMHFNMARI